MHFTLLISAIVASPLTYKPSYFEGTAYQLDSNPSIPANSYIANFNSQTQGGQVSQFAQSLNSGSIKVDSQITSGVSGNQFQNQQTSSGGSSTSNQSTYHQQGQSASSWNAPPTYQFNDPLFFSH